MSFWKDNVTPLYKPFAPLPVFLAALALTLGNPSPQTPLDLSQPPANSRGVSDEIPEHDFQHGVLLASNFVGIPDVASEQVAALHSLRDRFLLRHHADASRSIAITPAIGRSGFTSAYAWLVPILLCFHFDLLNTSLMVCKYVGI